MDLPAELTGDYEDDMSMKGKTRSVGTLGIFTAVAIVAGILCSPSLLAQSSAPKYEVDVSWPKLFPDRWMLVGLGGVCVDPQNHVFLLNRQDVLDGDFNAAHPPPPTITLNPPVTFFNSYSTFPPLTP